MAAREAADFAETTAFLGQVGFGLINLVFTVLERFGMAAAFLAAAAICAVATGFFSLALPETKGRSSRLSRQGGGKFARHAQTPNFLARRAPAG